jgi:hypothetical protein
MRPGAAEFRRRRTLYEGAARRVRMVDSVTQGALIVGSDEQWEIARHKLAQAYAEAAALLSTDDPDRFSLGDLVAQDYAIRDATKAELGYGVVKP